MAKILVATDKPFAAIAVKGIREVVEGAGDELILLEKYGANCWRQSRMWMQSLSAVT